MFTCGFVLYHTSLFETHVETVEKYNNNFDVILVMHLFICRNGRKPRNIHKKDTTLLFELGQILIQTINRM